MRSNGPPTGSRRVISASMSAVAEGSADPSADTDAGLKAPNKIEITASHDVSKYRQLLGIAALTFRQCLLAVSRECREGLLGVGVRLASTPTRPRHGSTMICPYIHGCGVQM